MRLLIIMLTIASAFTDWQRDMIRRSIESFGPPDAVFLDAAMNQDYAHTDMQRRIVSIDAPRFDCCPKTFANVVEHELAHCSGRNHNTVPGDIMNYSMRVKASGDVIDDFFIHATHSA